MATNPLGAFLQDRRGRLDPAAFGFPQSRRRTPGLRREEVAQRAGISTTWYTWLEQGRGGAPSAPTLDRISRALMLTDVEREHLFLLGLGHPPEAQYQVAGEVSPTLQRVLDALRYSPAFVKTSAWDVIAQNHAARTIFLDYGKLPPEDRNIMWQIFCNPRIRAHSADWDRIARTMVSAFRIDTLRAGASERVETLIARLTEASSEFAALWREQDVASHGEGTKTIHHPQYGAMTLEFSTFAVDGRPDLAMLVYNAVSDADAQRLRTMVDASPCGED